MSIDMLDDITPEDLGLAVFKDFRDIQREATSQAVYNSARFQGLCMPTGSGKSGIPAMIAKLTGWRTCTLTATKGLMTQYGRDFDFMYPMRGRANYECWEMEQKRPDLQIACDDGARMGCSLVKGNGCNYEECRRDAKTSQVIVTNYAYWFAVNQFQPGLERNEREGKPNPFECLVLDECHLSPQLLSDYLSVKLYEKEIRDLMHVEACGGDLVDAWRSWAALNAPSVEAEYELRKIELMTHSKKAVKKDVQLVRQLEQLLDKIKMMAGMVGSDWVCEYKEGTRLGRVWGFDAVWPGRYAERYLFRGIPKVVLMSATLRPKTMGLLWIKKEESEFTEWPKIFPANRCPVYFVPPRKNGKEVRLDRNTTEEDKRLIVEHMDQIIDGRLDRKGLICTVSYHLQEYLMEHSRHRHMMIGNTSDPESGTAADAYKKHVESREPTILVSPSFSTGWDFPYLACEYVIACKIAFPDGRSKVMQARKERDDDYPGYLAILDFVQTTGRAMRAFDDQAEVFLLDGHWAWFGKKNAKFAPMGFVNGVRWVNQIPSPPPKLALSK